MNTVDKHKNTFGLNLCNLGQWNLFNLLMTITSNFASVHVAFFSAKGKHISKRWPCQAIDIIDELMLDQRRVKLPVATNNELLKDTIDC